ncbi:MAG: hydrogenase formation protein HypD, partial [Methanomicrobium sp.]|nr:hydrogenase formation protein HypD [Methanomicrobium sp.]
MSGGKDIKKALDEIVDKEYTFMHICGTHEAAIAKSGLRSVLPKGLKIVMGPGCPVC